MDPDPYKRSLIFNLFIFPNLVDPLVYHSSMSATDYTLSDPSLLTPAQREMQLRQQDGDEPQSQFYILPDNLETGDGQPIAPDLSPSSSQALISLANTLKIEFGLSPKYSGWLDRFVNVSGCTPFNCFQLPIFLLHDLQSSEAERMVLNFAFTLHTAQLLERLAKTEKTKQRNQRSGTRGRQMGRVGGGE